MAPVSNAEGGALWVAVGGPMHVPGGVFGVVDVPGGVLVESLDSSLNVWFTVFDSSGAVSLNLTLGSVEVEGVWFDGAIPGFVVVYSVPFEGLWYCVVSLRGGGVVVNGSIDDIVSGPFTSPLRASYDPRLHVLVVYYLGASYVGVLGYDVVDGVVAWNATLDGYSVVFNVEPGFWGDMYVDMVELDGTLYLVEVNVSDGAVGLVDVGEPSDGLASGSVSPVDGLVALNYAGGGGLALVDVAHGSRARLSPGDLGFTEGSLVLSSWSARGYLAVAGETAGGGVGLVLVSPDGRVVWSSVAVADDARRVSVYWSPSGGYAAVHLNLGDADYLAVVGLNGSEAYSVRAQHVSKPAWLDAATIAYAVGKGSRYTLEVANLSSGEAERASMAAPANILASAGGGILAFDSNIDGSTVIVYEQIPAQRLEAGRYTILYAPVDGAEWVEASLQANATKGHATATLEALPVYAAIYEDGGQSWDGYWIIVNATITVEAEGANATATLRVEGARGPLVARVDAPAYIPIVSGSEGLVILKPANCTEATVRVLALYAKPVTPNEAGTVENLLSLTLTVENPEPEPENTTMTTPSGVSAATTATHTTTHTTTAYTTGTNSGPSTTPQASGTIGETTAGSGGGGQGGGSQKIVAAIVLAAIAVVALVAFRR